MPGETNPVTTNSLALLCSLVFGSVSGKFRSVVAHFLFFEPNIELRWTRRVFPFRPEIRCKSRTNLKSRFAKAGEAGDGRGSTGNFGGNAPTGSVKRRIRNQLA